MHDLKYLTNCWKTREAWNCKGFSKDLWKCAFFVIGQTTEMSWKVSIYLVMGDADEGKKNEGFPDLKGFLFDKRKKSAEFVKQLVCNVIINDVEKEG